MKIGINTLAFRQGGGVERYILDLINGFHQEQIILVRQIVLCLKINLLN